MPLPSVTFADFAELTTYIDNTIKPNGAMEIDGEEANNCFNGLLTFIEQSPLNWETAQVISTGGSITQTRPVAVFITNTPASLQWIDNIYNQYIFINTTGSAIPLGAGYVYYDINLVAKNTIPSKTIISIAKAGNGLWINTYNSSSGTGGTFTQISDTITVQGSDYTNSALIGASELKWCILDKQIYTIIDGDFTFNDVLGTLSFSQITLFPPSTILIPFKS